MNAKNPKTARRILRHYGYHPVHHGPKTIYTRSRRQARRVRRAVRYANRHPRGKSPQQKRLVQRTHERKQRVQRKQQRAYARQVRQLRPAPFSMLDYRKGPSFRSNLTAKRVRRLTAQTTKFRSDVQSGKLPIGYKTDLPAKFAKGLKGLYREDQGVRVESPQADTRRHEREFSKIAERQQRKQAAVMAPAVTALEQTTRPIHAIAAASQAALKGKNVPKAALRGAQLKDKTTFSDVLKTAGAPKPVQGVGGFALDVALDPTTYLSFGAATPARKLLEKEGERVAAKAAAKGMSKAGVQNVRRAAIKRAARGLPDTKGVTVRVKVPGVKARETSGRTTAAVARKTGASKVARKVRPKLQPLRHVRPSLRPEGVPEPEFQQVRQAQAKARATGAMGQRRAQARAQAFASAIPRTDYPKVIDAIESNNLGSLSDELRPVAKRLQDDYKHMNRLERQAGIAGRPIRDYFPHVRARDVEPGAPKVRETGRAAKLGSSKHRTIQKPLSEIRQEDPSLFSEDVPLVHGTRGLKHAKGMADAELIRAVAKMGRRLHPNATWDTATEAVYRVKPSGLEKLEKGGKVDVHAIGKAVEAKQGQHVILNKKLADDAMRGIRSPDTGLESVGRFWDRKLQGRVKTALTVPNPQYHLTNLYGDLFNAYLGDVKLRSIAQSARGLRQLARRQAAAKTLDKTIDPGGKGLKIQGKQVSFDKLIQEAEAHGAVRTGFIGRDLPEVLEAMSQETAEKVGTGRIARHLPDAARKAASSVPARALTHPIQGIRNLGEYREDFVRLATYIQARKTGASAAEAAAKVAKYHFDYGDLTAFERTVLRRVFPFYTWTARNVPLQAVSLVRKPGKFANVEKAREELAKAAGLPQGYEGNLEDYEQRGTPFPVPGVKLPGGLTPLVYPKLPLTDLNKLTTDPSALGDFVLSMLSPIIKTPVEWNRNYNFFFRGPIDELQTPDLEKLTPEMRKQIGLKPGDTRTLVPAPSQISALPGPLRRSLGIQKYTDKRSGKRVWGWPAKLDYLLRQTPASGTAIQLGTDLPNRLGRSAGMQLFGYGTGLKVSPYNEADQKIKRLMREYTVLQGKAKNMRHQGRNHTHEYKQVYKRIGSISKRVNKLSRKRGDKTPLFNQNRGSRDPLGLGGGSSGSNPLGIGGGGGADPLNLR